LTEQKRNEKREAESGELSTQNILRIADELVKQVDRAKKLVLIMILGIIIAVPVSWHLAPLIKGVGFSIIGYTAIGIALIFIGIGARQWSVLSKWTKRYKAYKQLQARIDKELDFEAKSN
jgi:hypothetical protein